MVINYGEGGGIQNGGGGGTSEVLFIQKGGGKSFGTPIFSCCKPASPYIMTIPFENFEDIVLLSSLEIRQELCEIMISIGQGNQWYKVLVSEKMAS